MAKRDGDPRWDAYRLVSILLAVGMLVVGILGVCSRETAPEDQNPLGLQDTEESPEKLEPESPNPESSEPPPVSPKRQDVSENESRWETTVVISRGTWVSQEEWRDQALRRVRVAEPDEDGQTAGTGVELEVTGFEPCQLVLISGQEGVCGSYKVVLRQLTRETATLVLTER